MSGKLFEEKKLATDETNVTPHALSAFADVLPLQGQRWTPGRKAAVIEAVRHGALKRADALARYDISMDEFIHWENDYRNGGQNRLRVTIKKTAHSAV